MDPTAIPAPVPDISVITPTHSVKEITKAKESLTRQSFKNWEWIILVNGKASIQQIRALMVDDPRIKVHHYKPPVENGKQQFVTEDGGNHVGALKKAACSHVTSPLCVEFDHDDELAFNCLAEVVEAFKQNEDAVFVYSDVLRMQKDKPADLFDVSWGWGKKTSTWQPTPDVEPQSVEINEHPPLLPQNVSKIWYAPDHVRAWRMETYKQVGGHNPSMSVCDDLNLMCKLFLNGRFAYIPKILYRYNIHDSNTWKLRLTEVQNQSWANHDRFIEKMALIDAQRNEELAIDLGGAHGAPKGWKTADQVGGDFQVDLEGRWPWEDNSVAVFRAHDIIEHISDKINFMNEAYRCLKHGGLLLIEVPSTDGRGAFQDPTHVSFWNTNSFWYYTRTQQQNYIKHTKVNCKFQEVRILNHYPSEWHQTHEIVYAKAHLAALKGGPLLHGETKI